MEKLPSSLISDRTVVAEHLELNYINVRNKSNWTFARSICCTVVTTSHYCGPNVGSSCAHHAPHVVESETHYHVHHT